MDQIVKTWTTVKRDATPVVHLQTTEAVKKVQALDIVNVGKGHYKPGDQFTVLPARAEELIAAGLVKEVGDVEDVPKEARADDGAYAEEPATPLSVAMTREKVSAELPIEEEVAPITEKEAEADNQAIVDAEADKATTNEEAEALGQKEEKTTVKTKEEKATKNTK